MPEQVALHRFAHEAMTTEFEVLVAGRDLPYANSVAEELFSEIDRLERLLSRFESSSDVSRINALAPGEAVHVAPETMECLLIALWAASETGGAFDMTVGSLMACWRQRLRDGQPIRSDLPPPNAELEAALRRVGAGRLRLEPDAFLVRVDAGPASTGVSLDLGGIGKGYALDRAAELLVDWDVGNALLHAGTSTALAIGDCGDRHQGGAAGKGWPLGIGGDWGRKAGRERVVLRDLALSGSGMEVKGAHVLDPRTGRPVQHHLAAWAVSPSAAVSDALSTAFMVMTTEEVRAFCAAHDEIGAFVVCAEAGGTTVDLLADGLQ